MEQQKTEILFLDTEFKPVMLRYSEDSVEIFRLLLWPEIDSVEELIEDYSHYFQDLADSHKEELLKLSLDDIKAYIKEEFQTNEKNIIFLEYYKRAIEIVNKHSKNGYTPDPDTMNGFEPHYYTNYDLIYRWLPDNPKEFNDVLITYNPYLGVEWDSETERLIFLYNTYRNVEEAYVNKYIPVV